MKIELLASLCAGSYMATKCGLWVTNGHWSVKTNLTKRVKSTPELDDHSPDYGSWLSTIYMPTNLGLLEEIQLQHAQAISHEGEIATWVYPNYVVFLELGTIWVGDPRTPIMVTADGKSPDIKSAIAWVMPMNFTAFPESPEGKMLESWLVSKPAPDTETPAELTPMQRLFRNEYDQREYDADRDPPPTDGSPA